MLVPNRLEDFFFFPMPAKPPAKRKHGAAILTKRGRQIAGRSQFLDVTCVLDPASVLSSLLAASHALQAFHERLRALCVSPRAFGLSYPLSLGEVGRVILGMTTADEAR